LCHARLGKTNDTGFELGQRVLFSAFGHLGSLKTDCQSISGE
jgi:hypothetical protein